MNKTECKIGNTLDLLKELDNESIQLIITSPPYWGLRDYGEEAKVVWDREDSNCEHKWGDIDFKQHSGRGDCQKSGKYSEQKAIPDKKLKSAFCKKCGAWYGQLGLEPTLELYLNHLLQITSELKRVLKPDGVMFWNHGDCYGGSLLGYGASAPSKTGFQAPCTIDEKYTSEKPPMAGYKAKCMVMQNYRLILKMIDEQGWILRNDIIWYKPNHMPSSVKDRFANSYEHVFMLVKKRKYYFDLDAVKEEPKYMEVWSRKGSKKGTPYENNNPRLRWGLTKHEIATDRTGNYSYNDPLHKRPLNVKGKNPGDLWKITTKPFKEAHFATFPEKLIEPMIKVGCPEWVCKKCGKAKKRIIEPSEEYKKYLGDSWNDNDKIKAFSVGQRKDDTKGHRVTADYKTVGWTECGCNAGFESGTVLDPFAGSGTTGKVCQKYNRNCLMFEINSEYGLMIRKRCHLDDNLSEWLDNGETHG